MATVALIDDHALFRAGLRSLLAREPGLDVVAEAGEADGAYRAVENLHPDVVVLDVALPGANGISVGREILKREPRTRLLALSMHTDSERVAQAFEAGFIGYATKSQTASQVVDAIREVSQGRRYLAPSVSPEVIDDYLLHRHSGPPGSPLRSLTAREREIFDLTVKGLSNEAIGAQLGISRRTVETHRSRILRKLHAHNAMDLVRMAAQLGLLET